MKSPRSSHILICLVSSVFLIQPVILSQQMNDWENPELVSLNTLSPHAWFIPYPDQKAALENKPSPFILSLDGNWKFDLAKNPSERPAGFFKNNYNVRAWKNIKVPANWQVEGYDRFIFTDVEYPIPPNPPFVPANDNPVGSYRKSFSMPAGFAGKNIFIRLGAVNSFFYLWINGKYIGLSKDSKTPAEFDITKYVHSGQNNVSIQVFRFSDGTYLEGQDMWKLSGIERSVEIIARPLAYIADFSIKALLDNRYKNGLFQTMIKIRQNRSAPLRQTSVLIKILDDKNANRVMFQRAEKLNSRDTVGFGTEIRDVRTWNAECPNLYTLIISLLDGYGRSLETIVRKIGFRTIEIKQGLLLVNGVAVKLKGVNRHEHDMLNGKVISRESMVNDIRLFKHYNINAMRCSHYPNREEWYEYCDRYGIYVIDEPNIECDGMDFHPMKTLSDKVQWKAAYLDRTRRMFERDKNFTCVIIWSLGNESRWGDNFIATHDYLKSRDSSRPLQYEEARDNPYTDIIAPMYKPLSVMQEYVREWHQRPLIQVEYAHMMGNSGGNFKDDWDLIYKYPQLQGGFIWDFSDQTFSKKDLNGRRIWAYGRDMGNVGLTSDTSFCADGMLQADRSPHPQAFEVQKVYQNINFEPVALTTNTFKIINHFDFSNLEKYRIQWQIKADGKLLAQSYLPAVSLEPHQSMEIKLHFPAIVIRPHTEYFLDFEVSSLQSSELLPANTIIAREQFRLPWYQAAVNVQSKPAAKLILNNTAETIRISGAGFSVVFNKKTGWLQSFISNSHELLKAPLLPHFWRPATDNDIGNSQQIRCAVWQHALDGAVLDSIRLDQLANGGWQLQTTHRLPKVDATYRVNYIVLANAEVNIQVAMKAGALNLPELPRFGMQVLLEPAYDNVTWFGRGPFDNYCDRNAAATIDLYKMKADSLFFPYARAQESGYRTGLRWMSFQNNQHQGLLAVGKSEFSAGVLHFNMAKLEFNRDSASNNHGGSIINDPMISWNIDYKQMGVGGDNSWGLKTHAEYLLPYGDYQYQFTLCAFDADSPLAIVKQIQ